MTAMRWEFEALDTLFFRGPAPFHAGEGGQVGQQSLFPPSINTIQGAIRYQLAVARGWSPGKDRLWPKELGDNDNLGDLRLRGPFLCKAGKVLYPVPLFLLRRILLGADGDDAKINYYRLIPGEEVQSDLGQVRLPVMPAGSAGAKPMVKYWLTKSAMEKVLAGGVPSSKDLFSACELWKSESKVGIKIDTDTRTAKESMLYTVGMVRPFEDVTLVVSVDGVQREWARGLEQVVHLGGEGKLARLQVIDEELDYPSVPKLTQVNGKLLFTVSLITPGLFGEATKQVIRGELPDIPGRCVTACLGKVEQVGGWDLKLGLPRPLRPLIPTGSTWFFEGDPCDLDKIKKLHGCCLGDQQSKSYGYGHILIGRWEDQK